MIYFHLTWKHTAPGNSLVPPQTMEMQSALISETEARQLYGRIRWLPGTSDVKVQSIEGEWQEVSTLDWVGSQGEDVPF